MKKVSFSNSAKLAGISITALLLLGAGGCSSNSTATPATDTKTQTTPTSTISPSTQSSLPQTSVTVVTFINGKFTPASVTIKVGDAVQFINSSDATIRVASDPHPSHTGYPGFDDLKTSAKGESYTFTFAKAGTFGYHNHLSPSDKGTVIVQ